MNKPKAKKITSLLSSAANNLKLTENDYSKFNLAHIVAEEAGILYRFMPRARGSAGKIRRRQARIKVLLTPNN
jgi:ribosomal protein L22